MHRCVVSMLPPVLHTVTPFSPHEPAPHGQLLAVGPGGVLTVGVGEGDADGHVDWLIAKDLLVVPHVPSG